MEAMPLHREPVDPALLLAHAEFVGRMARALVRNEHDADDLVQDTLAAALEKGPARAGPLRPWLAGVLKRRAADVRRKQVRRAQRERRQARPERVDPAADVAARLELSRRVVDAVLALREPFRTAVLLRHYDGLPPREIAAETGAPVETVRTRVRRGVAEVRRRLDADPRTRRGTLAMLVPPQGSSTLPVVTGVVAMKKIALVSLLLLAAGLAWHGLTSTERPTEPEDAVPPRTAPTLETSERAAPIAPTEPGRAGVVGIVLDGSRGVGAAVSLHPLSSSPRTIVSRRPSWLFEDEIGGSPAQETTAAADGSFRFEEVAAGCYELRAERQGRLGSTTVCVPEGPAAISSRIELAAGAVLLSGRARHTDGRPFRGFVRVHHDPGLTSLHTPFARHIEHGQGLFPTDDTGAFVVRGVPRGQVVLSAFRPGHVRYVSRPVTLPDPAPFLFIVDEGVREVVGRVTNAVTEHAVAGAVVTLSARSDRGHRAHVRTRTDPSGAFRAHIAGADLGLHVHADGFAEARHGSTREEPITQTFYGPGTRFYAPEPRSRGPVRSPVRVALLPAATVTGRVLTEGRPIAGVSVFAGAVDPAARPVWLEAATDRDGRYRFEGLPPTELILFAAGPGWVSRDLDALRHPTGSHAFSVVATPGGTLTRDLEVVASATLSGRVLDADGRAVEGCVVHARPAAAPFPLQHLGPPAWLGQAVTDAGGAFRLDPLVAGHAYRLYADDGVSPVARTEPHFVGSGPGDALEIRLEQPHALAVRVVDADSGAPIPHARVRVAAGKATLAAAAWWTDDDGVAHVRPVPLRDHYTALAHAEGYVRQRIPITLSPQGGTGDIRQAEIRLVPAAVIAGRVLMPAEVPSDRVVVELQQTREGRRRPRVRGRTSPDPSGHFRFRNVATDGTYRVHAVLRWDVHDLDGFADAAPGARDIELSLDERAPGTVWTVRAQGPGEGVVSSGRTRFHWRTRGGAWRADTVDLRHGRAAFRTESVGVVEAHATVFGTADDAGRRDTYGARSGVRLPPAGGEVMVKLPHARVLAGSVTCDGDPVEGALLRVVPATASASAGSWNAHAEARSAADGAFVLRGLGAGPYQLHVRTSPAYMSTAPIEIPAGQRDVAIALRPSAGPRVTVLDPAGRPARGVRVAIRSPGEPYADLVTGRLPPLGRRDQRTGADGGVTFREVPPDVRLDLHVRPEKEPWAMHIVRDWRPGPLTLRLEKGLELAGRVRRADGEPPSIGTRLWHRRPGAAWQRTKIGSDGAFVVGGLAREEPVQLHATEGMLPPSGETAGVRAVAGARAVDVEVHAGVKQGIEVEGWRAEWDTVLITAVAEGIDHGLVGVVDAKGRAALHALEVGRRYALHVGPTPDGHFGWVESFTAGAGTVRVRLALGEQIEGVITTAEDAKITAAYLRREGIAIRIDVAEDGSFRVDGLRPGRWRLRATARQGREVQGVTRDVETGSHVRLHVPSAR